MMNFGDAFKGSLRSLAINAVGEVAANEIGNLAHDKVVINAETGQVIRVIPAEIGKAKQLALHAALGCGMGLAGGNDCGAGAAAGVVGESFG